MGVWDSIGNIAAYGLAPIAGAGSLLGKKNVRDAVGGFVRDPVGSVQGAWDWASGANATQTALNQQMAGADKANTAITGAYNQGMGLLTPYMQGGVQDYQSLRSGVQSGAFNPQFQAYQGPMTSAGQFSPQYQAFGGPMSSGIQAPQFQQYNGPMTSAGQFSPQLQGYSGPMTSGNQLPQFQQFQGQSQYQAAARPDRMAGTTENVNMYQDPGYQFRLNEGLNAIQSSAAAKGLLGSSGTLKGIQDYAQGLASQEFGNAYGRMMQDQSNRQADFESDRGFGASNFNQNFQNAYGMNRDLNAWNAQNADRGQAWFEGDRAAGMQNTQLNNANAMNLANFNQGAFEGDRAAGLGYNQLQNQYSMNAANFNQGAFEGDRAAGLQNNQFANTYGLNLANFNQGAFEGDRAAGLNQNQYTNTWNANNAQNNFNMANALAGMGFNAAGLGANMATNYGQSLADLYQNIGNMQGLATMTQSNQRRGLFGDLTNLGAQVFMGG